MIFVAIVAGIFVAELFIKGMAERQLREKEEKQVCKGALILKKYHNRGAFLNAGERHRSLVAGISLVLCVLLAISLVRSLTREGRLCKTGLSLLLGGALSNTYDRLRRKYVVDYFSFGVKWKPLRRIVFNLSDFCILFGVILALCGQEEGL